MQITSPFFSSHHRLDFDDFLRFSKAFGSVYSRFLPTVQKVDFLSVTHGEMGLPNHLHKPAFAAAFREYLVDPGRSMVTGEMIFLPYETDNGDIVAAIVQGADPAFAGKVSSDWLLETKNSIEKECLLIKQARVDFQTGLLNGYNLHSLLSACSDDISYQLVLIEIPPRQLGQKQSVRHVRKYGVILKQFLQEQISSLHYLDHFTYALLLRSNDKNKNLGRVLVSYLKREGCSRVHVGLSSSGLEPENCQGHRNKLIYQEALEALQRSIKRGPFGFCEFSKLSYPDDHPLAPPPVGLQRKMSRKWRDVQQFCLVLLRGDSGHRVPEYLSEIVREGEIIFFAGETFWLQIGIEPKEAELLVKATLDTLNSVGGQSFSAGISYYPCAHFSKSASLTNCRKAIKHASFYGPGQTAVFDGTTLNITGDMYFGDGDLAQAVKEYRDGLKCNPDDVNLHNSLGVAFVLMNKIQPAIRSFNAALEMSPDNSMALYNLGQAELERKNRQAAYTLLVRANDCYDKENSQQGKSIDLLLQLGELAVEQNDFQQAVKYLLTWREKNESCRLCGRECLALGRAYIGLGDNKLAISELQRALRFNEFDDHAMHLLGYLYFLEKEGNEIALALCRKSVELASGEAGYRLYLGIIEMHCGSMNDAETHLRYCLRKRQYRAEAQLQMGNFYRRKGDNRRARQWYRKVTSGDGAMKIKIDAQNALREKN